jgi:hypothetical protein
MGIVEVRTLFSFHKVTGTAVKSRVGRPKITITAECFSEATDKAGPSNDSLGAGQRHRDAMVEDKKQETRVFNGYYYVATFCIIYFICFCP